MNIQELSGLKELHHAYIVSGSAEHGAEEVLAMLEKRGVKTKGNADVLSLSYTELLIEHALDISTYASLKPLDTSKYLIVSFSRATREAQNGLLKVVEDAPGGTIFFFCVDAVGHLLPTLQSRAIVVSASERGRREEGGGEAKEFLKSGYAERLSRVEKMIAYISKTQDRAPVRAFTRGLLFAARVAKLPAPSLRDLLNADRYLRLQGSSPKAILSHLAVSLPRS